MLDDALTMGRWYSGCVQDCNGPSAAHSRQHCPTVQIFMLTWRKTRSRTRRVGLEAGKTEYHPVRLWVSQYTQAGPLASGPIVWNLLGSDVILHCSLKAVMCQHGDNWPGIVHSCTQISSV